MMNIVFEDCWETAKENHESEEETVGGTVTILRLPDLTHRADVMLLLLELEIACIFTIDFGNTQDIVFEVVVK